MKSSTFQRAAYARRAAQLAQELLDWSKIYSRRSYGDYTDPRATRELEAFERKAEELGELGMQLQRIAIALEALQ